MNSSNGDDNEMKRLLARCNRLPEWLKQKLQCDYDEGLGDEGWLSLYGG